MKEAKNEWKRKVRDRKPFRKKRTGCGARLLAGVLTAGLTVCTAAGPALAAAANTTKEEIVYINLDAAGAVEEIYVVNSFTLDEAGTVLDYGTYSTVRNMTSTQEVVISGDEITISADAGKVYYEGKLEDTGIPWNISITYSLDGQEVSAEELAGAGGALEIHITVEKNEEFEGTFYEDYALQMSVTLDTNLAENITAEGATAANVGTDRQLSYTMLAGTGGDFTITADVTDFEMEAISINGIRLNLNVEVDDEELLSQVSDLTDAIAEIDDGAADLSDGISEISDSASSNLLTAAGSLADGAASLSSGTAALSSGGTSLESGAASVESGAAELAAGMSSLSSGIAQIESALEELLAQSDTLTDGSEDFLDALMQLDTALAGVSLSTDSLETLLTASTGIAAGINSLTESLSGLEESVSYEAYKAAMLAAGLDIDTLYTSTEQVIASLSLLNTDGAYDTVISLLSANLALMDGTETYLETVHASLTAILTGAETLQSSYTEFDGQIQTLAGTLTSLAYQVTILASAVDTLVTEYSTLNAGIAEYTAAVAQIAAGCTQVTSAAEALVSGASELADGASELADGVSDLLSGVASVYAGSEELADGSDELADGVAELADAIAEAADGSGELSEGSASLRGETEGLTDTISEQIDTLLADITAADAEVVSFVSEKNTEVELVQFVIQTQAVEIAEVEEIAETEEVKLTFWQKLLKLFGFYSEE